MAAKKVTNKTTRETAAESTERYELIPLKDIDTTFENVRTGDFTKGDSEESEHGGQSHQELVDSISAGGQRTPVVVRVKGKKFQLVSGFRRYAAIKHIAEAAGDKDATIKAIVKPLDDYQALVENITENQRSDISGPDLAWGLERLVQQQKARGENMSDRDLAKMVGKNNGYVSQLRKIVTKAPKVAKLWHDASVQLGVRDMVKIAKIEDQTVQLEKYKELLTAKTPAGDGSGKGPGGKPWLQGSLEKAEKVATMIGTLERIGCIGKVDIAWDEQFEVLGIRVSKDANAKDKSKLAKKCREAYADARDNEPEEPEEVEEAAE